MLSLWCSLWLAQASWQPPSPASGRASPAAAAAPAPALAPVPGPLTLEEVLEDIEARHPQFAIAAAELEAAAGVQRASRGGWDPVLRSSSDWVLEGTYPYRVVDVSLHQATPLWGLGLAAGFRHSQGPLPSYKGYLQTEDGGEIYAHLRLPLLRGGAIDRRRANVRLADRGASVATYEQVDVGLRLRRDATSAFWAWAAAAQQAQVEQDLLALAQLRQAHIVAMVDQGEVPDLERVDNQRAILQRQERLLAARRTAQGAAIRLSLLWRTPEGAPRLAEAARAPARLPQPPAALALDLAGDIATALARRPDLGALVARQEAAATQLALARNEVLPELDVTVGVARELHHPEKERADLEVGARLSLPLALREGRGRAQAARAAARRRQLERGYLQDRLISEVQDVHSRLATATARWQTVLEEVGAAHAVESAERERFVQGESSILVVNLREQARADAAKKLIEMAADYWSAWGTYRAVLALTDQETGVRRP